MRNATIARNYAEALLSLARQANDTNGYGAAIDQLVRAIGDDAGLRLFLESPRTSADEKNGVLLKAYQDRMPSSFLRFLQTLVRNRRQMLLPEIATEYRNLLDEAEGRVHAEVTVARATTDAERATIAQQLSRVLGATVVPHLVINPEIMGGIVVRVGDTVMDGSVRRRLATIKTRMLAGQR
jgi:F-type H+-transporting ATPase subunit delta